jgi:acetyltransferase-like isoleucine patch superfamily enzyme
MPKWVLIRRALVPAVVARLYYFYQHRAVVSGWAEVDLSSQTRWGRGCVISSFVKIKIVGPFTMGEMVHIGTGSFLHVGPAPLEVGDDVLISPNCTIITSNYRYDRLDIPLNQQGTTSKGIRIGRNVWVGANAVVLDGADIGDNAIVAAGSVVSGRIPPNTIVQGNPAKVIFTRR